MYIYIYIFIYIYIYVRNELNVRKETKVVVLRVTCNSRYNLQPINNYTIP